MNQIILRSRTISYFSRFQLPSILLAGKQQRTGIEWPQAPSKRNLFTDEVLGVDKFVNSRSRVQSSFQGYKGILFIIVKT